MAKAKTEIKETKSVADDKKSEFQGKKLTEKQRQEIIKEYEKVVIKLKELDLHNKFGSKFNYTFSGLKYFKTLNGKTLHSDANQEEAKNDTSQIEKDMAWAQLDGVANVSYDKVMSLLKPAQRERFLEYCKTRVDLARDLVGMAMFAECIKKRNYRMAQAYCAYFDIKDRIPMIEEFFDVVVSADVVKDVEEFYEATVGMTAAERKELVADTVVRKKTTSSDSLSHAITSGLAGKEYDPLMAATVENKSSNSSFLFHKEVVNKHKYLDNDAHEIVLGSSTLSSIFAKDLLNKEAKAKEPKKPPLMSAEKRAEIENRFAAYESTATELVAEIQDKVEEKISRPTVSSEYLESRKKIETYSEIMESIPAIGDRIVELNQKKKELEESGKTETEEYTSLLAEINTLKEKRRGLFHARRKINEGINYEAQLRRQLHEHRVQGSTKSQIEALIRDFKTKREELESAGIMEGTDEFDVRIQGIRERLEESLKGFDSDKILDVESAETMETTLREISEASIVDRGEFETATKKVKKIESLIDTVGRKISEHMAARGTMPQAEYDLELQKLFKRKEELETQLIEARQAAEIAQTKGRIQSGATLIQTGEVITAVKEDSPLLNVIREYDKVYGGNQGQLDGIKNELVGGHTNTETAIPTIESATYDAYTKLVLIEKVRQDQSFATCTEETINSVYGKYHQPIFTAIEKMLLIKKDDTRLVVQSSITKHIDELMSELEGNASLSQETKAKYMGKFKAFKQKMMESQKKEKAFHLANPTNRFIQQIESLNTKIIKLETQTGAGQISENKEEIMQKLSVFHHDIEKYGFTSQQIEKIQNLMSGYRERLLAIDVLSDTDKEKMITICDQFVEKTKGLPHITISGLERKVTKGGILRKELSNRYGVMKRPEENDFQGNGLEQGEKVVTEVAVSSEVEHKVESIVEEASQSVPEETPTETGEEVSEEAEVSKASAPEESAAEKIEAVPLGDGLLVVEVDNGAKPPIKGKGKDPQEMGSDPKNPNGPQGPGSGA